MIIPGPSSVVSLPQAGVSFRNSLRAGIISGLVFPWPWSGAAYKEGRTEVWMQEVVSGDEEHIRLGKKMQVPAKSE